MSFNDKNLSEKCCEACGEEFSCGAAGGNCWCFEFEIAPEDLEKLKKNFKNCLCRKCLVAFAYQCQFSPSNL